MMKRTKKTKVTSERRGFTLVELALSLSFISILSITVALIVSNAITNYHRGVILNQINTVGMDVVDDMRMAVQNSHGRSLRSECSAVYSIGETGNDEENATLCNSDGGVSFSSVTIENDNVKVRGESKRMPVYGAFCTGNYSYIWNSGYLFDEANGGMRKAAFKYRNVAGANAEKTNFKLLKVKDEDRSVCISTMRGAGRTYGEPSLDENNYFNISDAERYNSIEEEPVDLMQGDNSLALYSLSSAATEDLVMNETFYATSFILATIQGGINIKVNGDYCVPPSDVANAVVEAFDYCAINKFNFAAQANGG